MEIIIRESHQSAVNLTADIIANALRKRPDLVLGLATGRTMEALYAELARRHKEEGLDFSKATTFNLDEYIGLPPEDPNSYRYYMKTHLFDRVNINPDRTHLPDGMANNIEAECALYEQRIKSAGGIDLQLLGIGRSGHIGFNEPLSALFSRTRPKALAPWTIEQNAPLFPEPSLMPRRAITMGVGTILDAGRCLMLATGAEKAEVVAKATEGPMTAMLSATALQVHPRCTVIVDEDASARLANREYYDWVFENEPEWEAYR